MTTFAKDGRPSTLPPIRDLAARVRDGEDLHDIATQYGLPYQSLTSRFSQAGFVSTGETVQQAQRRELRAELEATRPRDEKWMLYGACAGTDPEAFYPERGGSTREAIKVCQRCPVRLECLDWALAKNERFGVFGGLSEQSRRKLQLEMEAAA